MIALRFALFATALVAGASALPDGRDRRVVDGKVAAIEDIPWAAQIEYLAPSENDEFQWLRSATCAASIVSPTQALTAAHCIEVLGIRPEEVRANADKYLRLRVGTWAKNSGGKLAAVKSVVVHPKWLATPRHQGYDIALIELAEPLPLSDVIKPIKLATEEAHPGDIINNGGWGLTSKFDSGDIFGTAEFHEGLKRTTIRVLSNLKCNALKHVHYYDDETPVICAEPDTGYGNQGDSGSGVWNADNELVGVYAGMADVKTDFVDMALYAVDVTSDPIKCFISQHFQNLVTMDKQFCEELEASLGASRARFYEIGGQ